MRRPPAQTELSETKGEKGEGLPPHCFAHRSPSPLSYTPDFRHTHAETGRVNGKQKAAAKSTAGPAKPTASPAKTLASPAKKKNAGSPAKTLASPAKKKNAGVPTKATPKAMKVAMKKSSKKAKKKTSNDAVVSKANFNEQKGRPQNTKFTSTVYGVCHAQFYAQKSYCTRMDGQSKPRLIIAVSGPMHWAVLAELCKDIKKGKSVAALKARRSEMTAAAQGITDEDM